MDRRTRILGLGFAALVGFGFLSRVVYPAWIAPQFKLDERIAERRQVLEKLEEGDKEVQKAKKQFKEVVTRIGTFDVGKVDNDLRKRVNQLLQKHGLQDMVVTPNRATEDRKTGIKKMTLNVKANGTLESAIKFLKDAAELPHPVRMGNPSILPIGGGRKSSKDKERVSLRLPIDVMILPQQKLVGKIADAEIVQPETFVRHESRDYAKIWDRKPFTEFEPLKPLNVQVARDFTFVKDSDAAIVASATGGDGMYTFAWSPAIGLTNSTISNPKVDTGTIGARSYTLAVNDGVGNTASAVVNVAINDPPPAPPPAKIDPRWPNRKQQTITSTWIKSGGDQRFAELMVFNNTSKQNEYYKPGDPFDGGTLLYIHQRGAVVERENEYFVYPIGSSLDIDLKAKDAVDYPEIQEITARIQQLKAAATLPSAPAGEQVAAEQPFVGPALPPETAIGAPGQDQGSQNLPLSPPPSEPGALPQQAGQPEPGQQETPQAPTPKRRRPTRP